MGLIILTLHSKINNPNNVIDGDIFYPLADALHRHKK